MKNLYRKSNMILMDVGFTGHDCRIAMLSKLYLSGRGIIKQSYLSYQNNDPNFPLC